MERSRGVIRLWVGLAPVTIAKKPGKSRSRGLSGAIEGPPWTDGATTEDLLDDGSHAIGGWIRSDWGISRTHCAPWVRTLGGSRGPIRGALRSIGPISGGRFGHR